MLNTVHVQLCDVCGLRTVTLKVDCPQTQCDVNPPDFITVSLRLLDLITVTDCVEYSVSHVFVLFNLTHKFISDVELVKFYIYGVCGFRSKYL